jgi:HlyD family secretion protein
MPDSESQVRATLQVGSRRRWWPWALGGALVVAAGAAWWSQSPARPGNSRYVYDTVTVERGELEVKVTAVGTLEPSNAVSVSSELSGIVKSVLVDENDRVQAGQLLAELDTELLEAQAREARARYQAARATLAQARATAEGASTDLARAESLVASGSTSRAELDRAQTAHRQAVAGVSLAEAQLDQARAASQAAQTNLDKAKVTSPIDGVVLERTVDAGQAVVSSLQAATMFRVAEDLTTMTVDVEVDEADIGRIEAGQAADFTVAAYADRVFDAEVTKVNLAPTGASDVVTYLATLTLDNPDMALLPGMTATASITAETYTDALIVPSAALRWSPDDSTLAPPEPVSGRRAARVWVLSGEEPEPVDVFPKATDGKRTVVESDGLTEGALVVIDAERSRRRQAADE